MMNKEKGRIQAFYMANTSVFLRVLKNFSEGHGWGEYNGCYFASQTEEGEEDYLETGVCLYYDPPGRKQPDIIISYDKFYGYLLYASEKHLRDHPENKEIVNELMEKVKTEIPVSDGIQPINFDPPYED